ncbi:MAG TPA: NUDIX hydrolase [Thermoleophilaceae bacterium]|nr:NUDIX hydrolase [Thermoleophilaceae bacterium]
MVKAAGGVVVRGDGRIALVHRPRYDDWTLPKGKLDPGETFEDAALREVLEETGFSCDLGREVGSVEYTDNKGREKIVRFFEMFPMEGEFRPNEEVDAMCWVTVDEARAMLTYDRDRDLTDRL